MKKCAIVLAILVTAALIVSATGCGRSGEGQKKSAYEQRLAECRELMKEADDAWAALDQKIKDANTRTQNLIMSAMAPGSASAPRPQAGIAASAQALSAEVDRVKAKYQAMIKPEFRKYKGPSEYISYAEAMLKAIDANKAVIDAGASLLAMLEPILSDPAAVSAAVQQNMDQINRILEAQKAAAAAVEEAQKIKTSEGLGTED